MSAEVTGADTLARTLRGAARGLTDWSAVNSAAGAKVAADAKRRAPHRTGRLANSIAAKSDKAGTVVTAGVRYAAPVESGTRYVRARPYLRPALADADVVPLYQAHIDRTLSKVKGA